MPNLKVYVDETIYLDCRTALSEALGPIRTMLCQELSVDVAACQFAIVPVVAMPDLPAVNVEMQIMPKPERTRERLLDVCGRVRAFVSEATHARVAVRIATLDPQTYVALK